MQKIQRRSYIIDLNGPAARGNLNLLGLLYPAWGLVLPIYFSTMGTNHFQSVTNTLWQTQSLLVLLFLGILYFAISIVTNRLVLTSKIIRFGHRLVDKHNISDLKALALVHSPSTNRQSVIQFIFSDVNNAGKVDSIETEGMEFRMRARLMAAVDNFAPQCQTPKAVRALLMQSGREMPVERSGDTVTMPYHSRLLMAQLKEMLGLYQQYFWLVWLAFFGIWTIIIVPLCLNSLYIQLFTPAGQEFPYSGSNVSWWNELWSPFMNLIGTTVSGGNAINLAAQQATTSSALCAIAFGLLTLLGGYLARPNKLIVSKDGIKLKLVYFGTELSERILPWNQLTAIDLSKAGRSSPANWKINMRAKDRVQSMQLTLGAIRGRLQRLELVSAVEKYAGDIPIQSDFLSALAPPSENSYTELWISSLASAPQREKLTPLNAGHALKSGEYIIDARHGAGGQGVTYLAHKWDENGVENRSENRAGDIQAEPDLVIKETVLPVYVDSQNRREAVEHFENDAKLLLRLEHHSLVKLRDYFIEDHRAYLVLDRIQGKNLRQIVDIDGALKPSAVIKLAEQMCEILTYLHTQNPEVIHRDFTPENLMMDLDGQIKLIDFGVAHEIKSRTTATVVGKHAYLPPEQFRGKPSTQSDLYAMGATLYFLLLGHDPEPLSKLNPKNDWHDQALLNDDEETALAILTRAIEHCTELEAAKRTTSAAELLADLDRHSVIKIKTKAVDLANG